MVYLQLWFVHKSDLRISCSRYNGEKQNLTDFKQEKLGYLQHHLSD